MKMWEHTVAYISNRKDAHVKTLNEYSRGGWELVAVNPGITGGVNLWFKREKRTLTFEGN